MLSWYVTTHSSSRLQSSTAIVTPARRDLLIWLRRGRCVWCHISSTLSERSIDTVWPWRTTVPKQPSVSIGAGSVGCSRTNAVTTSSAHNSSTIAWTASFQNWASVGAASLTGPGYPYGDAASSRPESGTGRSTSGSSRTWPPPSYTNAAAVPPDSRASNVPYSGV